MRNEFTTSSSQTVTMRLAASGDERAIERLAALDSQRTPAGELMVAEVGGEIRAAVSADGRIVIADPFHSTTGVVTLLRERVSQDERQGARGHGFGFRLARAA